MKKTWLSLCALAALAGAAHAQSSVQILGTLDTYFGTRKMAGDAAKTTVLNSGGMTTSWFGFKGTEDLGGGMKASFALTSFIQTDTGSQGRFAADTFFSRDANVSLSGGFGSITLGRALAPNFLPTIITNPFGDSFAFSPLVLHANVPLFNGTGWAATTPSDTGWGNEIVYSPPTFIKGLSANIHYQLGEVQGNSSPHNAGFNVLYFGGPLTLTGFYERDQITNPAASAPFPGGEKKTDWMVGAAYDFTVVKAFATWGKAKSEIAAIGAKTASLGVAVPVGGGKILAGTARTRMTPGNTRRTTTVGYDYFLSKNTDLYAMYVNDRISGFSSGNSLGLGVRLRF
ncbi:MAG: porin [Burkholderiaceae bacterium]|nr:porin [Burkholderiaceae bacterium]